MEIRVKPTKDPYRFDVSIDGKVIPQSRINIELNASDMKGVVTMHRAKRDSLGRFLIDDRGNPQMESTRYVFRRWHLSDSGFIFST